MYSLSRSNKNVLSLFHISLIVFAISIVTLTLQTAAQSKDSLINQSKFIIIDKQATPPNTVAGPDTVVSRRNDQAKNQFTVELKDGRIYISNFQIEDGKTASFDFSMAESKYGNFKEIDIKKRIYSNLDGQRGVYLITDKGILFVIPKLPETTIFEAIQKDTSKVLTYMLLPDGRLVGTTQSTFLLINSKGGTVLDYVDILGVQLFLQNPTITASKETNHIIIRDPTLITEDGQQFMIDLDISKFKSKIVPYEVLMHSKEVR
jgi:hypothetical protein